MFKANARGEVNESRVTLRQNDDLQALSGLEIYEGYIVEEISANRQSILFGNQHEVSLDEPFGSPTDSIIESQIRYTIEEHFRKARRLRERNIKILSLFFIPAVADYVADDGFVRTTFDRAFKEIADRYTEWKGIDPATVRAAYFATYRRRGKDVAEDTSGKTENDQRAYNLIMRNKATLASPDEPVAFIFSHTALREGWDSPNVFQICTLNRTRSNLKKRQEVGRGVRLAVDASGDRVHDERVNVLTVVCNDNYERFVKGLQDETIAEFGPGSEGPKPGNARLRGTSRLHKGILMNPDFLELWNRIQPKTRYNVKIDSQKLVSDTVKIFKLKPIPQPRIKVDRAEIVVNEREDEYVGRATSLNKTLGTFAGALRIPNVIDLLLDLLERTTPPIRVTRKTLFQIYKESGRSSEASMNPQLFAEELVGVLRDKLVDQMIDGIKYVPNGDAYLATQFDQEIDSWESALVPVSHSIYDYVVTQSDPERDFALGLDARNDIRLFMKLPGWFSVDTPLGSYNPDWAIVKEPRDAFGNPEGDILYLVRETKGNADPLSLRKAEYLKTLCGKAHFTGALRVDYAVVSSPDEV
jgi:type III restriction enzyme